MLTPEYLLRISEGGEELASQLHTDIINRIIERIAKRLERGDDYILTAQDKWHIQLLQECGLLLEDIKVEIAKASKLMETEIADAMEDAGVKAIEYDNTVYEAAGLSPAPLLESPQLIRLMQRTYEKTIGEWKNFTGTFADVVQQSFIEACDTAYSQVASGALSYSQAYLEAIDNVVLDGPKVKWTKTDPVTGDQVVYHTDTLETATLRCIRTGVSQASGEITDARMEEMDWDIILVSSHLGARVTDAENYTNHYWWQGKFYSKSGKDKRFPPYSVCGPGHVQGIHGANCRHSHGPGDGEFNPFAQYDSEENQKEYELQQKQRELERRIRKSKQNVMGYRKAMECCTTDKSRALAEEKYQREAALLQKRNKAYNDFCKENNLKKLNERLAVAKWDREQAAKARGAAKKYQNNADKTVAKPDKDSTIEETVRKAQKTAPTQVDAVTTAAVPQQKTQGKVVPVDVLEEYRQNATPGVGSITYDDGYDKDRHLNEVRVAKWLHTTFGGRIHLLNESTVLGEKTADYLWNDHLWDLKTVSTEKAANTAIKRGLSQIKLNPGGIILDYGDIDISIEELLKVIDKRMQWLSEESGADIMVVRSGDVIKILRYKK